MFLAFSPLVNAQTSESSRGCYVRAVEGTSPTLLDALVPTGSPGLLDALSEVWEAYGEARRRGATPFVAAAHTASFVDRLGFAFAVGYPAALERMVPGIELPCALCVTEDGGNHPRAIQTTLTPRDGGYRLAGEKSFVTFATRAASLVVAARSGVRADGRPEIAVVRLPPNRSGIELVEHPPTPFVPEVPHARLVLRDVEVRQDERLPGDGYSGYVKPFRTIEDIHVLGTAFAYLVGVARRGGAAASTTAALADGLVSLDRLSVEPPLDPRVHVALHGVYQRLLELTRSSEIASLYENVSPEERSRWERDQRLLQVASKAREARFVAASKRLGLS